MNEGGLTLDEVMATPPVVRISTHQRDQRHFWLGAMFGAFPGALALLVWQLHEWALFLAVPLVLWMTVRIHAASATMPVVQVLHGHVIVRHTANPFPPTGGPS